jgi:hypothetical protein
MATIKNDLFYDVIVFEVNLKIDDKQINFIENDKLFKEKFLVLKLKEKK